MQKLVCALVALSVLMTPSLASAGGCGYGYSSYYTPTYYQPTYEVKKFTVLEFVQPFFVGVPAAYVAPPTTPATGQAAAPAPSACDAKIAAMEAKYLALEARFTAAMAPQPPAPPQQPLAPTQPQQANTAPPQPAQAGPQGKSILAGNRCASCHDIRSAADKGGGLALSREGKALPLDDLQVGKVMRFTVTQHMPPRGEPLNQSEMNSLIDELIVMMAATKKK